MEDNFSPTQGPASGSGISNTQVNGSRSSRRPLSLQHPPQSSRISPLADTRRRASTISLDGINDAAQEMWRPRPRPGSISEESDTNGSLWQNLPLAFAILPALGGLFFKDGVTVISDVLLLGLAAVFLNWSVRLPWDWYKSAQELRIAGDGDDGGYGEVLDEDDLDYESESEREQEREVGPPTKQQMQAKEDESEDTIRPHAPRSRKHRRRIRVYDASKKELYRHELAALATCFAGPLLAAYLLHNLRNSLSRPSEGLVSNFNLTIFLLCAELRPMSHAIKLVQARTLHLQRIVKDNPYRSVDEKQDRDIRSILERLSSFETRLTTTTHSSHSHQSTQSNQDNHKIDNKTATHLTNEVRRHLQPDLDALNRAVRRYEKRATLQVMQTESRLLDLETRLGDAVALAAQAARGSERGKGWLPTVVEWVGSAVVLPWQVVGMCVGLPWRVVRGLLEWVGFPKRVTERPIRDDGTPMRSKRGGGRSGGEGRERGKAR